MKKFVFHECNISDFTYTVCFLIRNNKEKSKSSIKNFEKQSPLGLNPKIFPVSKTISDFELVLEGFSSELITNLTEDK